MTHSCALSAVLLAALTGSVLVASPSAQDPVQPERPPADPTRTGPQQKPEDAPADNPRPGSPESSDRIVVTATRQGLDEFDLPFSTSVIDQATMRERQYRTSAEALRDVPGVMVQQTSPGQGSPYIRGFTGQRNLYLVDGVRLNNSVFREGPNQYWNTVDILSLDRVEVVKGPSSVLYGSDAIGGTVQGLTKDPYTYAASEGIAYGGSAYLRYADAEDSLWGRGELSYGIDHGGDQRTGILLGGDFKRYGDIEAGGSTGLQTETGYDEWNGDLKAVHWFDDRVRLTGLFQRNSQTAVPRTHQTIYAIPWNGTTVGSDLRRDLYQDRWLAYAQLQADDIDGAVDSMHLNASWQRQSESRDRIRGSGAQDFQGFTVNTLGLWAQLASDTAIGKLTYGAEWYHDEVSSYLDRDPPQPGDDIQGPVADDASYDIVAIYLQDEIELSERFDLILGGRFNYAAVDAQSVRDPRTNQQIAIEDDWSDPVFSIRARYELIEQRLATFGGISQGFRAPNLSDLTRFDSARTDEFEIPSPGLEAENYLTYELGLKGESPSLGYQIAGYYTDIKDQIQRFPTGNTNSDGEQEITKANVGDGYLWGIDGGVSWRPWEAWTLFGSASYVDGRIDNYLVAGAPPTKEYHSRMMPLMARAGLRWDDIAHSRFYAETELSYAADADRLSARDEDDTGRIPPGGTPGYTVWNIRAGWNINDRATFFAALDNVLDEDYRVHGSGSNLPGRNLILALEARF